MKIFAAGHKGHYVRGYSIVVAPDRLRAIEIMNEKLASLHIIEQGSNRVDWLYEIPSDEEKVSMLFDGNP